MANDAHEEFWGCTLSKAKKEFNWNPTETEDDVEHKLQITSACLGHKVKDGERNLVELTTEDDDGRKITCSMVSLRAGGKECIHLELGFNNPTKFTLKEGNGPVSICGVHLQAVPIDFDEDESDSDDEDIPNLVEPKIKEVEEKTKAAKRPMEESKKQDKVSAAKKKKPAPIPESESDDEEEEDEEEEEEDEDEDEEMPSLLDGEAEEVEDEESEDEDEPEGDEVDSEEDDEEEDEDEDDDEESEEEETPVKKSTKKMTNGHAQKGKAEEKKSNKTPQKTPGKKAVPVTPKSTAGAKKTPEEIKAMLIKSPNLPKKFDKFANYMKNNLKVTDQQSQKEFWNYIQENKK